MPCPLPVPPYPTALYLYLIPCCPFYPLPVPCDPIYASQLPALYFAFPIAIAPYMPVLWLYMPCPMVVIQ